MKIEILHIRDSDGGCEHVVLVDGERVSAAIEDVDPGRGHMLSDWREHTEWVRNESGYSDEFRAMVAAERDEHESNQYIENDENEGAQR